MKTCYFFFTDLQHNFIQQNPRPRFRTPLEKFPHDQKTPGRSPTTEKTPPSFGANRQGDAATRI